MNYFLVVIMCIGLDCSTAWNPTPYESQFECEINAKQTVRELSTTFPDSDGEVYCLTKSEYNTWKKAIESGVIPRLQKHRLNQTPEQYI